MSIPAREGIIKHLTILWPSCLLNQESFPFWCVCGVMNLIKVLKNTRSHFVPIDDMYLTCLSAATEPSTNLFVIDLSRHQRWTMCTWMIALFCLSVLHVIYYPGQKIEATAYTGIQVRALSSMHEPFGWHAWLSQFWGPGLLPFSHRAASCSSFRNSLLRVNYVCWISFIKKIFWCDCHTLLHMIVISFHSHRSQMDFFCSSVVLKSEWEKKL